MCIVCADVELRAASIVSLSLKSVESVLMSFEDECCPSGGEGNYPQNELGQTRA